VGPTFRRCAGALLVALVHCGAAAAADSPLQPLDTSSPRATLEGFIAAMDGVYRGMTGIIGDYVASDRLYLSRQERHLQAGVLSGAAKALTGLDLSQVSPVLRDSVGAERTIQLKEILDRIELPPPDQIPDRDALAKAGAKRWRLPGTEIDIALVEDGPRAGEYLVSAATVERLPEFYDHVAAVAYKPGSARELNDLYRRLSGGGAATIYEAYSSSPAGLERIIPIRWMMRWPGWVRIRIAGVTVWQWLGFALGLGVGAAIVLAASRLGRRLARREPVGPGLGWRALPTPLALILVAAVLVPLLCAVLRIGGTARIVITFAQTAALFLAAAWLFVVGAGILAETIVASEHLRRRSLDSQLIRLALRFAGIAIAIGLLIQGAYELGFPAYSVLAGLGVGGLAVALAARDSLANLLGSLVIMIEKPFRIGHVIRVAGSEGTVEDVGFRSTRIRTADNSLISIPNNAVVNATVENLSLRAMRRQRFFVQVTYDTPRDKLEELAAGIKRLILDHPGTNKTNFHVRFNDFAESSLNILVYFYLDVADYATELEMREEILLQIMDLAKELGIEFAFPTRTLLVETSAAHGGVPRETAFRPAAAAAK
jgi:MscS family membrane protein